MKKIPFILLLLCALCTPERAQCPFDARNFDEIKPATYNRILVRKGNKWGFTDTNYAPITPIQYDIAFPFSDSCALVGKYDRSRADTIQYYDSQLDDDVIEIRFGLKYEIIGLNGKTLLNLQAYQEVKPFVDGLALVGNKIQHLQEKKQTFVSYGLINKKGQFVLPIQYIAVGFLSEGAFSITQNNKMGMISVKGDTLVPAIYDDMKPFSCGWSRVLCANGKYNFLNHKGEKLLPEDVWEASEFRENRAFVRSDYISKWSSLIDTTGNLLKLVGFQQHNDFSEGLCAVWNRPDYLHNDGKTATFINLSGEIVDVGRYEEVSDFCNGYARVISDKKRFFINAKGEKAACD